MVKENYICIRGILFPFSAYQALPSSRLKGPELTHLSIASAVHTFHCKAEMFLAFKLERFLFGLSNLCNLCMVDRNSRQASLFYGLVMSTTNP